jgi:hypothetical protein
LSLAQPGVTSWRHDEFLAEIADMRDRPAEAADANLGEDKQYFVGRTCAPRRWRVIGRGDFGSFARYA